jgi:SSS family solute:Na+ symporter
MLVCGYIGALMSKTHEDYLVAVRRLGFWTFFACMSAVILGGGATFGTAKLGYLYGISGFCMVFMYGVGILALAVLVTTRISNLRIMTLSEMAGMRYEEKARVIIALIAAVYAALIATRQIAAIGIIIIQSVLGWAPKTSMLTGGLIVLAYTGAGGMWSVTPTGRHWLMTFGVLVLLLMGLARVGGFAGLQSALLPSHFDLGATGGKHIFSFSSCCSSSVSWLDRTSGSAPTPPRTPAPPAAGRWPRVVLHRLRGWSLLSLAYAQP